MKGDDAIILIGMFKVFTNVYTIVCLTMCIFVYRLCGKNKYMDTVFYFSLGTAVSGFMLWFYVYGLTS